MALDRASGNRRPDRDQVQPEQRPGRPAGPSAGLHARAALLDRTRLATGQTGRRTGRLPGPGLAGLAPSHDAGPDGHALRIGRAPASSADSTPVKRYRYSGVAKPLPPPTGYDPGGGSPPDGSPPPKTAGGYQFSLSQTAT